MFEIGLICWLFRSIGAGWRGLILDALSSGCFLPHRQLVSGFQDATDATNEGFIIPPAAGWRSVYFLAAIGTNFYSLLHVAGLYI
jgi:UPF0716 family protein affecting phage T7 exclusion